MEWTKEDRAAYFEQGLTAAGYPAWGRAQRLADELSVTYAQASNWMTGSLPRDHAEIKRVAHFLNIPIMEWVYGESESSLNIRKLTEAIALAKAVEADYKDENMSAEDFAEVVQNIYEDRMQGAALLGALKLLSGKSTQGGKVDAEANGG